MSKVVNLHAKSRRRPNPDPNPEVRDDADLPAILEFCKGKTSNEIRSRLELLNADQRLKMIEYFKIKPVDLAGTVIAFWLRLERRGTGAAYAGSGEN